MREVLRVANMSGFFGDRFEAAAEMVRGGPIDVLTGDYLAELTLGILHRQRAKHPESGYARTFVAQMEDVLADCLARGIKVVTNAGGLNPKGLADKLVELGRTRGLSPKVAYVDGDDLLPRLAELAAAGEPLLHMDRGVPLSSARGPIVFANAYLGGWGIREALARGADVVVCGRVTDAALVVGPAAWAFDWKRDAWDALAGAVVAGHVLECGTQATGGNYSFFEEVPSFERVGFPIAEIFPDGSFVVTKHPGTGGLVSVGTVTAQLLYEIQGVRYANPDVVTRFDTLEVSEIGADRVLVKGARGEPAPEMAKVSIGGFGGFRNGMTVLLAEPGIEAKAAIVQAQIERALGRGPAVFDARLRRTDRDDPRSNDQALAELRITVMDADAELVGRRFSSSVVALALSSVPGFTLTSPPGDAMPYSFFWPALLPRRHLAERAVIGGEVVPIDAPPSATTTASASAPTEAAPRGATPVAIPTARVLFGRLFGARSGDKGGNASLGVWAKDDAAYAFLRAWLTTEELEALLPDLAGFTVERCELPTLRALLFVVRGLLGDGVGASSRVDPQAKTLGEYLRGRTIVVPEALLSEARAAGATA